MSSGNTPVGDALAAKIQAEAEAWDAPRDLASIDSVEDGDLPILDLAMKDKTQLSEELRIACEQVGFCYAINHGVDLSLGFEAAGRIRSLENKVPFRRGQGFVSDGNRVLPKRHSANFNESFIVKRVFGELEDVPWPDDQPFRDAVDSVAKDYEKLSMGLLPLYATALDLPSDYFAKYFEKPVYRMRFATYEPTPAGEFGISPHVDTSFFTLLASTDYAGLVLWSAKKQKWLRAKHLKDALIINTGQILAQITNDTWLATRHYVIAKTPRLSIPFFFNATGDVPLPVVPTKVDADNPPKYPPISYLGSQAAAQGE